MPPTIEPGSRRAPKTDATALALLGAMFLALAAVGSISLSATASETFQDIVNTIGFGRTSAVEAEQQRQAAALIELGHAVQAISADVRVLATRAKTADQHGVMVSDRFAFIDADIAAMAAELKSLRAAGHAPAALTALRETADQLGATVAGTRSEIGTLRASLDEHAGLYRGDIAAITQRLDRLEHMVARDLTGSIRTAPRKKQVRRKARGTHAAQLRGEASSLPRGVTSAPVSIFAPNGFQVRLDGNPLDTPQ